ncbi:PUS1 [Candida theae]|uniref:tRNA pseudouridine synthase 1 n=1 Tax=Candida theae TaxID=1198502 RepID=A0AAD5BFW5_9ASCO|nr:PUS1 [Candida theae]KAI5959243.1 PUS1 [Candida theae]
MDTSDNIQIEQQGSQQQPLEEPHSPQPAVSAGSSTTTATTRSAQVGARLQNSKERQNRQKYEQSEYVPMLDDNGNPIPKSERKPKRKCAVMIGYCGTGYNGLQIQNEPGVKTIEKDFYEALYKAGAISLENSIDLKKSGFQRTARTDKGVHAAGNVVSLKMIIEDPDLKAKINEHLPDQIRVWGIQRTTKGFDCRKMCSSRVYEYLLPTYSLLSPKPGSQLDELIRESKENHPGLFVDDGGESKVFWELMKDKVREAGFTQDQLDAIAQMYEQENKAAQATPNPESSVQESSTSTNNDNVTTNIANETPQDPNTSQDIPLYRLAKQVKQIENATRRAYRISPSRLDRFRQTMQQYKGTHNFHNFTIGKTYKDTSSNRYIIDTTISNPFVINNTEWISIKIHGQSFMLHQIRKMICMATLVIRCDLPSGLITDAFEPTRINVPKAPALGLLLENPVFDAYNHKLRDNAYDAIDFSAYEHEMADFKMKYIYDKIYDEEVKENVYYGFFGYIDSYRVPSADNDEEGGDAIAGKNGKTFAGGGGGGAGSVTIFDFLHNYIDKAAKAEAKK